MTWVRFRLGLPNGSWLSDVSQDHPEAGFDVLGSVIDGDVGYTLLSVVAPERDALVDDLETHPCVEHVEVIGRGDHETTIHLTGTPPRFVTAARNSGLPLEPPVEVSDGTADLEVAGDHDRLSKLGRQLAEADVAFDVRLVGRYEDATRVLTDTQRELVLAAIEHGYYDTPRQCTLTELAERHGIAKSTCSETLQRAEERLIKQFVERLPMPERESVETATNESGTNETKEDRKREVRA